MPATCFRSTNMTRYADRARSCRSWQAYIDDHLIVPLPSGGQLSSAAIVGSDGGVWAQSDTFPEASEQEVRCAITCCAYQPRRWLTSARMRPSVSLATAQLITACLSSALPAADDAVGSFHGPECPPGLPPIRRRQVHAHCWRSWVSHPGQAVAGPPPFPYGPALYPHSKQCCGGRRALFHPALAHTSKLTRCRASLASPLMILLCRAQDG